MSWRKTFLVLVLMSLTGWVGFWLGEKKLELSFKNWKPAVVVNRTPQSMAADQNTDFTLFWTVWDRVSQLYVDKAKLDPKKMVDGAISGMVAAIGDPYTAYLPIQQNKETKEDLGGAFEGVGMQLGFKESQLAVQTPLEGTPAMKAGVRAGDFILHILDKAAGVDRDTKGMPLPEAIKLIRGKKGTEVVLTMYRAGAKEPFEVALVRDTIVVKSVILEFLDPLTGSGQGKKVAWLKVTRFGDRTTEEWTEALSKINTDKPAGVVLDLRNNPGGYLEGAVYLSGEFLPAGKLVVSQVYGDGSRTDNKVNRNGGLLSMPLIVLVNGGSASAAEIMSGALQDQKRAKIVGEQSFGKGSVQQPEDFPDGSGIHVTIAKWIRPNGEWIDKEGITPDYVVEWDSEDTGGDWTKDPQLVKSVEIL